MWSTFQFRNSQLVRARLYRAGGHQSTIAKSILSVSFELSDPKVIERLTGFFSEFSQADLVQVVQKSPEMFPTFNATLRNSMLQATQLFIKNIVLAPNADVRSFYDSDQTFVDAALAPIYGVSPPASGSRCRKRALRNNSKSGCHGGQIVTTGFLCCQKSQLYRAVLQT